MNDIVIEELPELMIVGLWRVWLEHAEVELLHERELSAMARCLRYICQNVYTRL